MSIEFVLPGEKGTQRYRVDKRVKRYLLAKRPDPSKIEQLINYRTEACVGVNKAVDRKAPVDVIEQLEVEYWWAVMELAARNPATLKNLGYPARYWRHADGPQQQLF